MHAVKPGDVPNGFRHGQAPPLLRKELPRARTNVPETYSPLGGSQPGNATRHLNAPVQPKHKERATFTREQTEKKP